MIDLYLLNTIINIIWYIFTVLFVLYKFTSVFSYAYNFLRFCGKIFGCVHYVYDQARIYIYKRNGYIICDEENTINTRPKTIFQSCKDYISKKYDNFYYKLFGKQRSSSSTSYSNAPRNIPLTEITIHNSKNFLKQERDIEKELFDNHINELCSNNNSIELESSNHVINYIYDNKDNRKSTDDSHILYDVHSKSSEANNSHFDQFYFHKSNDNSIDNSIDNSQVFHEIKLTNSDILLDHENKYQNKQNNLLENNLPFAIDFNIAIKQESNQESDQEILANNTSQEIHTKYFNTTIRSLDVILEETEQELQKKSQQENNYHYLSKSYSYYPGPGKHNESYYYESQDDEIMNEIIKNPYI